MGFGPSQVLPTCSGYARPGQAGGGGGDACSEQLTRLPPSFLLKAKPPEHQIQNTIKVKPCMLHQLTSKHNTTNKYRLSKKKKYCHSTKQNITVTSTKSFITV